MGGRQKKSIGKTVDSLFKYLHSNSMEDLLHADSHHGYLIAPLPTKFSFNWRRWEEHRIQTTKEHPLVIFKICTLLLSVRRMQFHCVLLLLNQLHLSLFWREQKTPARKAFGKLNTGTQTSPPWWSRFPLQRHGFVGRSYPTPRRLCGRGWERPLSKGFSRINKLLDKII